MPKFVCKVKDRSTGEEEVKKAEAASKDELVNSLHEENKVIISITELKPSVIKEKETKLFPPFKKPSFILNLQEKIVGIRLKDKINFCSQLAALLESGITLVRALDILSQQSESRKFRLVILKVREEVKKGLALHRAFAKQPRVFSPLWINLVEAGEASGELPFILKELANYLRLSSEIRSKLTTALIYPSIVIVAAVAAMIVFVTLLVPMFVELFESFNTRLPVLTVMVVNISNFFRSNLLYIFIFLIAAGIIFYRYINTTHGRKRFDRVKLSLPILGIFLLKVAIVRFTNSLSVLIKGGVPILYSLEVVKKSIGNVVIADTLDVIREDVRGGEEISSSLKKNPLIPAIVVQMIQVGEETGELGSVLDRLTNFYREEIDTFISRFSVLVEPLLILSVGLIVAVLVAAMFLPIFMRATLGGV